MGSSDLLDQDVLSLESSDPEDSVLLAQPASHKEADVVDEGEDSVCIKSSQPASPAHGELLKVMALATVRLDLFGWRERWDVAHGKLYSAYF